MHRLAVLALVLVMLVGCDTSQAIYNISGKPILVSAGEDPTDAQLRSTIIRTLAGKRWVIKETGSGLIETTTSRGERSATILVTYSTKAYSIRYKDSANFEFNANKERKHYNGSLINRRYNGWIRKLEKLFDQNLAGL
jgi:hypothetical protein